MNQKNIDYRKSEKNNNTTIPRAIRYHPNTLKSCFLIYPIRNLNARIETTKETKVPTIRIMASVPVKFRPNFTSFNKLAPNMVGIARKKVYSAATVLEVPSRIPPMIVAPERDVPGMTAKSWNTPIKNAVFHPISTTELIEAVLFLL